MSVTLLGQTSTLSVVTSLGVAITVPAGGGYLVVYTTAPSPTNGYLTGVSSNSGQGETYAQAGFAADTVDVQQLGRYVSNQALTPGSFTVTVTVSTSGSTIGIAVYLISNTSGPLATCAGNYQAAPGTGAAGVTTGASGTLSSASAILEGLTITTSGAASITAAGGATQTGATIWGTIKANFGFAESLALSSTTSVAATFTSANGNPQVSVGGVWQQGLPYQPFNQTQWFVNDVVNFQ